MIFSRVKFLFLISFLSQTAIAQNLKPEVDFISTNKTLGLQNLTRSTYFDESYNPLGSKINYTMLGTLGALYLGTGVAVHLYLQKAWWYEQRGPFHIVYDWPYARSIDKIGHLYGTALLAHFFSAGFEASNLSIEDSYLYGGIAALTFQLYVETEDGFGPKWGFSPGDVIADILGATYSIGQYYYPVLKNFQFKHSYYPSPKYLSNETLNFIDDYEGQKYWLAFRMEELLPESVAKNWPDFLNLAVGYGVDKLDGRGGGDSEFYFALDLDAEQIPLYGSFWQFLKNTLNYVHFPLPGIRISPNAAFLAFAF